MSDLNIPVNLPTGRISSISLTQLVDLVANEIAERPSPPITDEFVAGDNVSITTDPVTGVTTISTSTTPTFDSVEIGDTTISTNGDGQLIETIGGVTEGILLTQADVVGIDPIQVTVTPTGIEISSTQSTQLSGNVSIIDSPTETAALTVVDGAGLGIVRANIIDANNAGGVTTVELNGNNGSITLYNGNNTQIVQDGSGFLEQIVNGVIYPIPTTSAGVITGTDPIIVTPITGGANISISPTPSFTSVGVNGSTLTSDGTDLFVNSQRVVTEGNLPIAAGMNIDVTEDPITGDSVISTIPNPLFTSIAIDMTVVDTDINGFLQENIGGSVYSIATTSNTIGTVTGGTNISTTTSGRDVIVSTLPNPTYNSVGIDGTVISRSNTGFLQENVGGVDYTLLTSANGITSVDGVGNIVTTTSPTGAVTVDTIPTPSFTTVDVNGATISSSGGILSSTYNGSTGVLLATNNTVGISPITVTPTMTGAAISISPTPTFSSVTLGSTTLSTDIDGYLQENVNGFVYRIPTSITSGGNIVTADNGMGGYDISTTTAPLFTTVNVDGTLLSAGTGGFLQETVNGVPYTLLTDQNGITTVAPGTNIDVSTTGGVATVSTINDPVFTSTTYGTTVLSPDVSGYLQETVGGNTYRIPTSITQGNNISVTDNGIGGYNIATTDNPFFTSASVGGTLLTAGTGGFLQETVNGTTYTLLTSQSGVVAVANGTNITVSTSNGIATVSTTPNPTFSTSVTTPLVNVTNGITLGQLSSSSSGQLQQTFGASTYLIPLDSGITTIDGVGNIEATTVGSTTTIDTVTTPTFISLVIGSTPVGVAGGHLIVAGSTVLNQGDIVAGQAISVTNTGTTTTIGVVTNPSFSGTVDVRTGGVGQVLTNGLSIYNSSNTVTVASINNTGGIAGTGLTLGSTLLSVDTNGNFLETIAGVTSPILTFSNTVSNSPNLTIARDPTTNIVTFTPSDTPTFTSTTYGTTVLSAGTGGFLQENVGGVIYPILTTATGITVVNGSGNITTSTSGSVVTVGMTTSPTFTNVTTDTATVGGVTLASSQDRLTSGGSAVATAANILSNIPTSTNLGDNTFKTVIMQFNGTYSYNGVSRTLTFSLRTGTLLYSQVIISNSDPNVSTNNFYLTIAGGLPFSVGATFIPTPLTTPTSTVVPVLSYDTSTTFPTIDILGFNSSTTTGVYTPVSTSNVGLLGTSFTFAFQVVAMGV